MRLVQLDVNDAVWQDLIKFTSTSHCDYDVLQKSLNIAQKYLFAADSTSEGSQACSVAWSLM